MRLLSPLIAVVVLAGVGWLAWQGMLILEQPAPAPRERARPESEAAPARREPIGPAAAITSEPAPAGHEVAAAGEGDERAAISRKNGRAIERLDAGDLEGAIELFEECLAADPDEAVFARNLAEALARYAAKLHEEASNEARDAALAALERAVELDSERPELVGLLERWRKGAKAEEDFDSYGSERFELVFDGFRPDLVEGIHDALEKLEAAYLEFGESFGFFPVEAGRPRIRVVFYRREQFDAVTGLGHWAGGVFDGSVRLPVEDLGREAKRVETVLRHELLHAFVQEAGGKSVPGWLNEGLAQWLETRSSGAREAEVRIAREKLRGRELFELSRLQGSLATWQDPAEIRLAYAQSLALTAYVARQYGERVLYEMVTRCKEDEAAEETFARRIGLALDVVLGDLQRELE